MRCFAGLLDKRVPLETIPQVVAIYLGIPPLCPLGLLARLACGHNRRRSTSWVSQDAQSRQISLCSAQFFDFGPENLTRDLEQARQDTTWRAQNKKWKSVDFSSISWSWKTFSWPYVGSFFFVVELAKYCFGGLGPNHVSKFQVQTSKIERCMAKFPPKCLCIQIYI